MKTAAAAVLLAVTLAGCAASVKRLLPEDVRTIAIARIQNTTDQELPRMLLEEDLRQSIRLDGRLAVVEDAASADAVLGGSIVSYGRQPSRFSGTNVVEEYLASMTIELTLTGRDGKTSLWAVRGAAPGAAAGPSVRRLAVDTHFVVVPASGLPPETEEDAQRRLVRDLADDAVIRIVEGW